MSTRRTSRLLCRCPDDDGTSAHLALDLWQPLDTSVTAARAMEVLSLLEHCPCGQRLVMRIEPATPEGVNAKGGTA